MESNGLSTGITREYIWLPGTEIAPTVGSAAGVPRPIAVVDGVNTGSPNTWWVHTDHLNRPVLMTNSTGAAVWQATWLPFGAPQAITGTATLNARFSGQWFQLESGLHVNWWRHYDPSTGRYTQVDPLGFVDGPSIYGYARSTPYALRDFRGLQSDPSTKIPPVNPNVCPYIPDPPGDCTEGFHRRLQNEIDDNCDNISCNPELDNDAVILIKKTKAYLCATDRNEINKKCFRGGNLGHRIAENNAWRSYFYCSIIAHKMGY